MNINRGTSSKEADEDEGLYLRPFRIDVAIVDEAGFADVMVGQFYAEGDEAE